MRRLFLKIFLWFWATVALTGISLVLAFILQPQGVASRWHASLADTTRFFGSAAVAALDQGGIAAASAGIAKLLFYLFLAVAAVFLIAGLLAGRSLTR